MKWLHNLLKGVSLTGALFVFQACYGTPQVPFDQEGVLDAEDPRGELVVKDTTTLAVTGPEAVVIEPDSTL